MLVKFDPPLGELYWAIDKQKPQDYYSFGIISKPKAYQKPRPKAPKSPTSIDSEPKNRGFPQDRSCGAEAGFAEATCRPDV